MAAAAWTGHAGSLLVVAYPSKPVRVKDSLQIVTGQVANPAKLPSRNQARPAAIVNLAKAAARWCG